MRIVLISETLPEHHDPIGSVVLHLVEHLETHGHICQLITTEGIPLLMGRTYVSRLGEKNRDHDLLGSLNKFQADIVHAIQPVHLGVQALGAARELGIPTIISFHTEFLELSNQWGYSVPADMMWSYFRILHDQADLTLVPTYFAKMHLRDLGLNRVETWTRGVDCDLFSPRRQSSSWRRHLTDGEPNKSLLLYAGRLSSEKHVELLVPVIKANPDCRLAIVGDGPELLWMRDYFDGTQTLFTGRLDQGDLAEVYASADMFVHPATTRISPVTTLEAMASGLPVLSPHSAAIVEFAVHGENALLFLPGETEHAANYVGELSKKQSLRADLSRIARHTALSRSWHVTLNKLMATYERLISQMEVTPIHREAHFPVSFRLTADLTQ